MFCFCFWFFFAFLSLEGWGGDSNGAEGRREGRRGTE